MKPTTEHKKMIVATIDHFGRTHGYETWEKMLELIKIVKSLPEKEAEKDA